MPTLWCHGRESLSHIPTSHPLRLHNSEGHFHKEGHHAAEKWLPEAEADKSGWEGSKKSPAGRHTLFLWLTGDFWGKRCIMLFLIPLRAFKKLPRAVLVEDLPLFNSQVYRSVSERTFHPALLRQPGALLEGMSQMLVNEEKCLACQRAECGPWVMCSVTEIFE